jgi:hypothetical protein
MTRKRLIATIIFYNPKKTLKIVLLRLFRPQALNLEHSNKPNRKKLAG